MKQQKRTLRRRGKTTPMKECRNQNEGHVALQSCRSVLLLIWLVKSESHKTRKDAKNGQRAKTKASTYASAIPPHEMYTCQRSPSHRHKLENSDDKSDSHEENSEDNEIQRRRRKQRTDNYRTQSTEQTHP